MDLSCPGKDANVRLESVMISCPRCGRDVEMFSDEPRAHCRCGEWVFRETLPSCAQWCPAAERCFGGIGPVSFLSRPSAAGVDQEELVRRVKKLHERIAAALAKCPTPEAQQKRDAPPADRDGS